MPSISLLAEKRGRSFSINITCLRHVSVRNHSAMTCEAKPLARVHGKFRWRSGPHSTLSQWERAKMFWDAESSLYAALHAALA